MNKILAIVGPTGIGKTKLSISIANRFNGEIVNADSRQIYRFMNIGTAKPTKKDLSYIPHHLIDIIKPNHEFSLAEYQKLAIKSINDIQKRHKLPILVGGSGLYVWSILEGWIIPQITPDTKFRSEYEKKAKDGKSQELYDELKSIDPLAAAKIDPRNIRRVIRALEVSKSGNRKFSELQRKIPPSFETMIIGLTTDRKKLYHLVDDRIDRMIRDGFVEEVRGLIKKGYNLNLPSMFSIGYREIGQYLNGEITLEEAIYKIKVGTHRFIRHQYAWFRLKDERIQWFDPDETGRETIESKVKEFTESKG